ncbi:MAG: hypothetical protein IPH85_00110 [Ignavibacteria bacterium]|nr:hypothetical protein [Ignavibacteria bacterium]
MTDTSYIRAIKLGNEKETVSIALTKEQIDLLELVDLKHRPGLDRVRWWFLAQCSTGVRFADLHKVTTSNVKDGILPIQPKKTKDQILRLPVSSLPRERWNRLANSLGYLGANTTTECSRNSVR